MKKWILIGMLAALGSFAESAKNLPADPDAAWKELQTYFKAPAKPSDWAASGPTPEQKQKFEEFLGKRSAEAAERAHEFYTRFPEHPKVDEAKAREKYYSHQAARYGNTELAAEEQANLPEDEKVERKLNEAHRRAMEKRAEGVPAVVKAFEAGVRSVMKEFPKSPMPWQALMVVVDNGDTDTKKRILAEIVDSKAADSQTIARAKGQLKALGALGRPLELAYTAVDGREVDVQKLKGKVVLIDLWATWCGPCMQALPEVVSVYNKYHDKGFEIVGISLDKSQSALEGVVERYKMAWPQYFDGKFWGNKFAIEYNISAIPTMWLVDKTGKLRTMNGRDEMEKQIKELLAE
jgi:thiol-disulfide isomerase/thioredoxin